MNKQDIWPLIVKYNNSAGPHLKELFQIPLQDEAICVIVKAVRFLENLKEDNHAV